MVRVFHEQAFHDCRRVEFGICRNKRYRRQAEGGAQRLRFQRNGQLHRIITTKRVFLSDLHGARNNGGRHREYAKDARKIGLKLLIAADASGAVMLPCRSRREIADTISTPVIAARYTAWPAL